MTRALRCEKQTVKDFVQVLFCVAQTEDAEWRLDTPTLKDVQDKDNNTTGCVP